MTTNHTPPPRQAFSASSASSSTKDLTSSKYHTSHLDTNDVSSLRGSEKSQEQQTCLLHCSNCGAFSAKSLDKLPASHQFENEEDSGLLDRKFASERFSRSCRQTLDANSQQHDYLETYSHDGATRRRSRSRHRNKHVHISGDVVSINNANYTVNPATAAQTTSKQGWLDETVGTFNCVPNMVLKLYTYVVC